MQNLLLELQAELQKTIIFITHDLDEALKLADHLVILKDGAVVQQGEPQGILLNPADPYIEDFVSDINRARVLRVKSVMGRLSAKKFSGDVQLTDNLESLIALSEGDTSNIYRVLDGETPVGQLDMRDLVKGARCPGFHRPRKFCVQIDKNNSREGETFRGFLIVE
jgi:glycine betaine/proline transport system ATP-binding protein